MEETKFNPIITQVDGLESNCFVFVAEDSYFSCKSRLNPSKKFLIYASDFIGAKKIMDETQIFEKVHCSYFQLTEIAYSMNFAGLIRVFAEGYEVEYL